MRLRVGVLDYGMGNLHSVSKALAKVGARVSVSGDARVLDRMDVLVVPGVGAFGEAAKNIRAAGLDRFVKTWLAEGRPYVGICLGFQLLFERSEESPGARGFGFFKGAVVRFRPSVIPKGGRIPHMGWNVAVPDGRDAAWAPLLKGIRADDRFYFVHSFYPKVAGGARALRTPYGRRFVSAVRQGHVAAFQFHPEKSSDVGLRLLKNVLTEFATC